MIYLKNGQKAELIEKIGDKKYLVAPYYDFYTIEGDCYEEIGKEKIVDKIFKNAPIEVYDEKIKKAKEILDKIVTKETKLNGEIYQLQNDINKFKNIKTNLNNLIINRNELKTAKRLTVIENFNPVDLKKTFGLREDQYGFKISFGFDISKKGIDENITTLDNDGYNSPMYINKEIGILVNKTDEEIDKIIKNLVLKSKINDYNLKRIKDKYLNIELLEKKNKLLKEEKQQKIFKLEKEIEINRDKIKNLQNEK